MNEITVLYGAILINLLKTTGRMWAIAALDHLQDFLKKLLAKKGFLF